MDHSGHMMNHHEKEIEEIQEIPFSSHNHHNSRNLHEGMMMYFHGGYNEVILFSFWEISSIGGLIGSMVGIFIMGVLLEGLKFYREYLLSQGRSSASYTHVSEASVSEQGSVDGVGEAGPGTGAPAPGKTLNMKAFSRSHCLQTLLHLLQFVLSYFLMLIAMTFNTWLCLAVAAGTTTGYFMFGWKKSVLLNDREESCH